MERTLRTLIVYFILIIILIRFDSRAYAQDRGSLLSMTPSFGSQPLSVPTGADTDGDGAFDTILVDNFEYWDSPYNHGWIQTEPPYPIYGFGIGFSAIFNTVLDLQEGSRVLDVFRPNSPFLLGTPYEKHGILHDLSTPSISRGGKSLRYIDLTQYPVLSFEFKAFLGIEFWDIFRFDITGKTKAGYDITVQIGPWYPTEIVFNKDEYYPSSVIGLARRGQRPSIGVKIDILRHIPSLVSPEGSWHVIWIDIQERVKSAIDSFDGIPEGERDAWYITRADRILITGQMFRMDDISFRDKDYLSFPQGSLDIFELGPLYAQIFEPYRYILMAEYVTDRPIKKISDVMFPKDPKQRIFITDPNEIRDVWISDLLSLDPNYHVIDPKHPQYDPNYMKRWIPGDPDFGKPDPVAGMHLRKGFFIDSTLPIFADKRYRIGGSMSAELRSHGTLGWNTSINGYGQNAIQAFFFKPLPINPYDGMPTYIMNKFSGIEAITRYGQSHFGPAQCFSLESALWNSGVELWPNIAYMDYTPQYFEDLIISVEVSNGITSEVLTFPVSVVNYPVENYPPQAQPRICPRLFPINEKSTCVLFFLDPDCFIFSMAQLQGRQPATTHIPGWPINDWSEIRNDQDSLLYRCDLSGFPTYIYGPWIEDTFDPYTGLFELTPKFEGINRLIVTCTDSRGATGFGDRPVLSVNQNSWLNHPPMTLTTPSRPQVARAGEEIIINQIRVVDPDGGQVYASCNIGSVGRTAEGTFIWSFQTNFPGQYIVEILFFDIRGGSTAIQFPLDVKPWWSY